MDINALRQRFTKVDPMVVDIAMAVGLAVLVCIQIYVFTHAPRPDFALPPNARDFQHGARRDFGILPYLIAACAFLPLAFRRPLPALSFALTALAAAAYSAQRFPPAFITLGPMIAVYSLASFSRRRHMGLIALLVAGLLITVPVFAFSSSVRWVAEASGTFALLAASALLGDTARNHREYTAEVEKRAADAEKTREEEALRRVEEERVRIARDVHDIVAHSLSIVTIQAGAAEAVIDRDPAQARESIRTVRATAKEALGELRSMLDVLRTGEGEAPLTPAADLTQLTQLVQPVRDAGLEVDLGVEGNVADLPAFASVSAYRIVQEALTNAVRHAKASKVTISVRANGSQLSLLIADNGQGAGAEKIASGGHGIRGMRERVEALGGTFSAGAGEAGHGFTVVAMIPLGRSAS